MKHFASPEFWKLFEKLPRDLQKGAKESFQLLKSNPRHPSLHFKKVGNYWSVRIGRNYRALGKVVDDGVLWGWIGTHSAYDKIIG